MQRRHCGSRQGSRGLRDELGEAGHAGWRRLWSEEPHLEAYLAAIEDVRAGRAA